MLLAGERTLKPKQLALGLGVNHSMRVCRRASHRRQGLGINCTLHGYVTSRIAGAIGTANKSALVSIASLTPLFHHPAASLITPHASQAALVTMASLLTASVSFGWALYLGAKSAWETLEPYLSMSTSNNQGPPVTMYDVDVTQSRFFSRPAVHRAAHFAAEAHRGQIRKTRQPYVTHCIETALIVERLLAPTEDDERAEAAVIAAILHDVVDDTDVDISEVEEVFGEQVATMVSKVSQLSQTNQLVRRRLRLEEAQPTREEAAQLRQMILTMVSEPLVIVIKLADRLHNMRTVYALREDKQIAVAQETRRVWCSLAERLGMFAVKSELEDLCFAVLQPKEYTALRAELDKLWGITTIPPSAVTPSDCCLSGECECDCGYAEDEAYDEASAMAAAQTTFMHDLEATLADSSTVTRTSNVSSTGGKIAFPWLGAASALLPKAASDLVGGSTRGRHLVRNTSRNNKLRNNNQYDWLEPQQMQAKELLDSVLPFDASTFNMERLNISPSARRGLEVLQGCAKALLYEITIEGVASGLDVSVQGRVKSLYSIFKKMARKGVPLSQVYDARALRVVVDDDSGRNDRAAISACYKLQPVVQRLWRKVVGEDDDYISQPKASGYQSLHTAVVGPGGIPMEVQIRTATMHEVAEYGSAAHWAYKERAVSTVGATGATGPEAIAPGHPVLQIATGGNLKDGVVVRSDSGGLRLLVGISQGDRKFESWGPMKASPQEYSGLLEYVDKCGYFSPGQGDLNVSLEMYTLCSDGKYHRLDQFGHKLPTTIVPLHRMEVSSAGSGSSVDAPEHGSGGVGGDSETTFMENRIRLLRSMLDWGADIGTQEPPQLPTTTTTTNTTDDTSPPPTASSSLEDSITAFNEDIGVVSLSSMSDIEVEPLDEPHVPLHPQAAAAQQSHDIMVLVWPSGKILQLPRGTTAGYVLRREKSHESAVATAVTTVAGGEGAHSGGGGNVAVSGNARYVNVNNRLVGEDTVLSDGDYVCTDGLERVKF